MLRRTFVTALTALLVLGSIADAETVSVHGSTSVSNQLLTPHQAEIEHISGQTLDIVANGSGRGLADLAAGKADMAMISAPLEVEVAASDARTFGGLDPARFVAHQVGEARVAFVVHPSNPVTTLTLAQITLILSGKITRW